ncbi:hypothetical protein B0T25DRAFT_579877 [Lasiosphaeria hispida]|uniref:Peptidase A1 domain-containing protein n=1 Tax=Lasiosphaeria hispida TaxID=260671 RepID=A0AAJ0MGV6_9PEZI|nr:hypothetical protein B0T25DRAFT_579877 [Lasiosphaeria hispida]
MALSTSTADSWVPNTNANMCQSDFYFGYHSRDPPVEWSPLITDEYSVFTDSGNFTDALVIGVLGLGPNETSSHLDTFIDRLVSSGKAITPTYSIWLDDPDGLLGNLLFGAIDESKYVGGLSRLKASRPNAYAGSFNLALRRVNCSSSESAMSTVELADLPVYATWDKTFERVVTNCEDAKRDDSTESLFELEKTGGPVLSVRLANLVMAFAPVKYEPAATSNPPRTPSIIVFESYAAKIPSSKLYCANGACTGGCKHEDCDTPPTKTPNGTSGADLAELAPTACGIAIVFTALWVRERRQRRKLAVMEFGDIKAPPIPERVEERLPVTPPLHDASEPAAQDQITGLAEPEVVVAVEKAQATADGQADEADPLSIAAVMPEGSATASKTTEDEAAVKSAGATALVPEAAVVAPATPAELQESAPIRGDEVDDKTAAEPVASGGNRQTE